MLLGDTRIHFAEPEILKIATVLTKLKSMITADENNQKENKDIVDQLIQAETMVSKRIIDSQKQEQTKQVEKLKGASLLRPFPEASIIHSNNNNDNNDNSCQYSGIKNLCKKFELAKE